MTWNEHGGGLTVSAVFTIKLRLLTVGHSTLQSAGGKTSDVLDFPLLVVVHVTVFSRK